MSRILVFDTAVGTTNCGDDVIYESIKANMKDIWNQGTVLRLGTHLQNFGFFQMGYNSKVRFAKNADLKFICGTNMLMNDLLITHVPQFQLNFWNASLYRGSILVGVGKTTDYKRINAYTRMLYRKILSREYIHSVRDEETKEILESMGFSAVNTGCPTLWGITPEKSALIPTKKSPNVIFSLSGYKNQQDTVRDRRMVETILENYEKVMAWIQTTADEEYIDYILALTGNRRVIEKIYSLDKYEDVLKKENVEYVGTRLHGGIFAMQHGCRALVIAIDARTIGIHETNNIPILRRKHIEELGSVINGEFKTEIVLKQDNIDFFLNQFAK